MDFYDSDATITEIEDDNTVPVINSTPTRYNSNNFVNKTSTASEATSINLENRNDIQDDPPLILHFCKMHGCGNDFVIFHIDSLRSEITGQSILPSLADLQLIARYLCDRTSGVGGNQLLVITPPPPQSEAQYQMLIFNSDGSMAENSGNGIRCLSKFIIDYQIPPYNNGCSSHIISQPNKCFTAANALVPFFSRSEGTNPYSKLLTGQPIILSINTIAGIMQCCPLPAHPQNNSRTLWVKVCMGKPKVVNTVEPITFSPLINTSTPSSPSSSSPSSPTSSPSSSASSSKNHVNISLSSSNDQCPYLRQQQEQQQLQQQQQDQEQQDQHKPNKLLSTKSNQEDYCKLLPFKGHYINSTLVSMGNPHCVVHLENVQDFPMDYYGEVIETHPIFPDKTNVEFVEVIASNQVRARVWQRGCGTTNACGTGACAIVVAGVLRGKTERKCTVHMDGGSLEVEWRGEDDYVFHSGPATTTFQGTVRFFLSELQ